MFDAIVGRGWVFPPHIGPTGGLALTGETVELEQAIRIILTTMPGERVMRPAFGCRLHELVFAPNNSQTHAEARRFVEDALAMWEPRIRVLDVTVQSTSGQAVSPALPPPDAGQDTNCLEIAIVYEVNATHDQRSLVYPFYLIPEE
jgi:uncharacterized protein